MFYANGNMRECHVAKDESYFQINWHNNGKIYSILTPVCSGKKDAVEEVTYHKNGALASKAVYNNGRQLQEWYYANGVKRLEGHIVDLPSNWVGRCVEWHENGKIKSDVFYEEGTLQGEANRRTGTWSFWDEDGNLVKQEIYKNNILTGTKQFLPKIKF